MKLNNLKIGQRLGLGFGLMVALLVLVAATGLTNMSSLNTLMRRIVAAHGLFGYLFTTVVIAAAINIVMSLGNN